SRRRIPDGNAVLLDELVPFLGVETGVQNCLCNPVRPGTDDAVGRAGYPTRIGITPIDIVRPKIEHPFCREILRHDRVVDVLRTLGLTRGAGGVVQNRRRLGLRWVDWEM